jgi:putative monooxygenase
MVFHLGPLAPRPELGHVDTEDATEAACALHAMPPDPTGAPA